MDLKLDTNWDLELTADGSDLLLVDGVDAIAQDLTTRLRTFLGEWFLDKRVGMPYFQQILGQKPRLNLLNSIFANAILQTPGIIGPINDLVIEFDGVTRNLSVSFRCDTVEGELTYNEEFIVIL